MGNTERLACFVKKRWHSNIIRKAKKLKGRPAHQLNFGRKKPHEGPPRTHLLVAILAC